MCVCVHACACVCVRVGVDARQQVVMQLLHSEWEYVSTLNHLYDKYKNSPQISREP